MKINSYKKKTPSTGPLGYAIKGQMTHKPMSYTKMATSKPKGIFNKKGK